MFRFRVAEQLAARQEREGRRISWGEVATAIGVSRQALATLAVAGDRPVVTNTAHLESLCRYFQCEPGDLLELDPPLDPQGPPQEIHVDRLYPGRRRGRD